MAVELSFLDSSHPEEWPSIAILEDKQLCVANANGTLVHAMASILCLYD
jgi:hypothetical protein